MNKMLATVFALTAATPVVAQDYNRLLGGQNVPSGAQVRFAECPAGTSRQIPEPGAEPICVVNTGGGYSAQAASGGYSTSSSGRFSSGGGYTMTSGAGQIGISDQYEYRPTLARPPTEGRTIYTDDPGRYWTDVGSRGGGTQFSGGYSGATLGGHVPGHPCVVLDPVPTEAEWNARGGPCRLVDIPRERPPQHHPPRYVTYEDSYYRREYTHTRSRYAREWHGQDGRYWREDYHHGGGHGHGCGCHDHGHYHGCGHDSRYASFDGVIFPGVGGRSPVYFTGGGGGRVIITGGGGGRSFVGTGAGSNAGANANASATSRVNVNTNVNVRTGVRIRGGGGGHGGGYGGGGHHGGGGHYGGGGGYGGGGYGGGGYGGGSYGGGSYGGGSYGGGRY
ncbi:hypothetical protein [Hyphobacterium sp.]|jgi:hypothetical protein|uniref:hypothetical protein n=1 Tax=Hyphobacterium sp. TaxID=2004662 RepID=UPI003BAB303E